MLSDITIGQFFPGDSVVHRIDPRAKIVFLIIFITMLFMASSVASYLLVALLLAYVVLCSKIQLRLILKSLKPLVFIIAFTSILNVFYTTGTPIVEWGFFRPTYEGLLNAATLIVRITMLITITSMLTFTTSPIMLTGGLESIMSPLKKIKFPVHELSMMMTIALRFIPTLIEETEKIMNAQKARGADFESGGLIKRAKALMPILIPLFISSFRRAEELAVAMEARCYTGGEGRTRMRQYKLSSVDYIAFFVLVLFLAAVIICNNYFSF